MWPSLPGGEEKMPSMHVIECGGGVKQRGNRLSFTLG